MLRFLVIPPVRLLKNGLLTDFALAWKSVSLKFCISSHPVPFYGAGEAGRDADKRADNK